ncbi:MAG: hypothetical protein ACO1Q7_07965 [Gemmatimonas sp.]
MMKLLPPFAAVTLTVASVTLHAQGPSDRNATAACASAPVVRELAPVATTASQLFRSVFMLRESSTGTVIVNDGVRRQLGRLDRNLSNPVVVLDSVKEGGQAYGPAATPLLRFVGDSSLFVDMVSRTLLVLEGKGAPFRTVAAPKQTDMLRLWGERASADPRGNLLYRAATAFIHQTDTLAGGVVARAQKQPDSIAIVRGLMSTRAIDTVGQLRIDNTSHTLAKTYPDGRKTTVLNFNPLIAIDEWTALPDGTIALARGQDYHIEFITPDGARKSTGKLSYNWKAMTAADKQRLIDSTKSVIERVRKAAADTGGPVEGNNAVVRYMRTRLTTTLRPEPPMTPAQAAVVEATMTVEFAPLSAMADYVPPLRYGSVTSDEDGNVWILPTTSDQSRNGELVYDVINARTHEFSRVRMPVGKSIAGFGQNGVIYLMSRHGDDWRLERTRVATNVSARD